MSFIDRLNRFIALYIYVIKRCWRLTAWLPFFFYAIFQFLLLVLLINYVEPHIYPILSPIISVLGQTEKEMFHHYPGLFILLPTVFQWLKIAAGVVFEGLTVGLASVLFLRIYGAKNGDRLRLSFAFRQWLHLIIAWTLITAVLVIINKYAPMIFSEQLAGSPRRLLVFDIILRLVTVALYSLFVYAVPAVIVYRDNALRAFRTSLSIFARYPIFSFFLAFIPYLLSLPVSYAAGKPDVIIDKFTPELVFYILTAGIILDVVINYIITGTVVKFLLDEQK